MPSRIAPPRALIRPDRSQKEFPVSLPRKARAVRLIALLILGLSMRAAAAPAAATATPALSAPKPGPGDSDPALYDPVLAGDREAVYAATAGRLPRYRIDATFSPTGDQPATITGTLDLWYYNGTGEAQKALYFRLYPNAADYGTGGQTLDSVEVGGERVTPKLSVADTVAKIPLAAAVAPEATVQLRIGFTTTIPTDPGHSYGMFAFDSRSGTYALAHWEPLLAGYDPVDGWKLDPPSTLGDPVFTNTALYDVALTVPDDLRIVTTGSETGSETVGDGQTRHHFVSGPVRDFVMAIDDDLESVSADVGGTTVRSWYEPDNAQAGRDVLRFGTRALETYGRLFGDYPYAEMDIVEVNLHNAGGVEFPQITFIESDLYDPNNAIARRDPDTLEFDVAHEIGHQWWYGMVGNDQYEHAFTDEGLTNYSTTVYFGEVYGPDKGEEEVDRNLKLWYFFMLFGGDGDQIVDQPTDSFPSQGDYGSTIYGKGALGFGAIREAIGDEAYFAALRDYLAEFRFKVATPDDLLAAFERASGQDLKELWRHWFEAAEGNQDYDVAEFARLRREYGI
jgi:hypothetical protein